MLLNPAIYPRSVMKHGGVWWSGRQSLLYITAIPRRLQSFAPLVEEGLQTTALCNQHRKSLAKSPAVLPGPSCQQPNSGNMVLKLRAWAMVVWAW